MKGLVGGPLLVGGLGPGPPPLKSGPGAVYGTVLHIVQFMILCFSLPVNRHFYEGPFFP